MTPFVVAVAAGAPAGLLETIAGLALLGTLAASAASAFGPSGHREAAALTFVVAASGVTIAGVGGAFGGLVAGGLCSWPCAVVTKTWLPGPEGRGEPLAEDMGFEPMRGFIPNTISNRAH